MSKILVENITSNKIHIGCKIRVKTKLDGDKLCIVDWLDDKSIHFKNKSKFGLRVEINSVRYVSKSWRGSNFEYTSFN